LFSPNFIFDFFKNLSVYNLRFFETGCKDNAAYLILPNKTAKFPENPNVITLSQNVPSFTGLQMYYGFPRKQALSTIICSISP